MKKCEVKKSCLLKAAQILERLKIMIETSTNI